MKKFLVTLFFISSFVTVKAQSYLGYYFDNYAGVQSTLYNPASIADSRFRADINLFSGSALAGNDYYGFKATDVTKSGFNFALDTRKFPLTNNNFIGNTDIMGPSFMFNLSPKSAIAVFTRARAVVNLNGINGELFNQLQDKFDNANDFTTSSQNANFVGNSWGEIGLSYAQVIFNGDAHFLKAGFSAKYLLGISNSYANSENVSVAYDRTSTNTNLNTITTKGLLTYGGNQDVNGKFSNKINPNSNGFGFDLGLVYEYRPNFEKFTSENKEGKTDGYKDSNKYKLRFGLSLTDIGSINYKDATQKKHNLTGIITEAQFDNNNTDVILNNFYPATSTGGAKAKLPTAFHLNADLNVYKKFYLNLNGDFSMTNKTAINTNSIANLYSLTPRYESKWFSFYLPVSMVQYTGFQAGAGFRLGPLFVGSGSVVSNLISNQSKGADVHIGLKIPLFQAKSKDQDGDGVLDNDDKCYDVAGPSENNGCPWPDADSDGIIDVQDKCPEIAGPTENKGCPYDDFDKDGTLDKDDNCINVAGPKENKGCPYDDTDKDGVFDPIDDCPTVFGLASNKGCPEIKAKTEIISSLPTANNDIINKIKVFSKTILFDTSKSTIKAESYRSLNQIVKLLNENQEANFRIEGHTDSAGDEEKNQKLSNDRAEAVRNYFIEQGISESRLTSQGYGSSKPISSNKTVAGKNLNRRVEINYVE